MTRVVTLTFACLCHLAILSDKVIHKQLAKAGLRLAAVLNTLLLPADAAPHVSE